MQLCCGAPFVIARSLQGQMVDFRCSGMQPVRFHGGQSSLEVFIGSDQGSCKARLPVCASHSDDNSPL